MRRFFTIALLSASAFVSATALPAASQEATKDSVQDPAKDDHAAGQHARVTWEEHFVQANQAHDGHLTLDEAKAGFPAISRHFQAIDVDGKGFVTQNDIRAWRALQKSTHRPPKEAEDMLRPRNAFRLNYPDHQPMNTNTHRTVQVPTDPPHSGEPDPELP